MTNAPNSNLFKSALIEIISEIIIERIDDITFRAEGDATLEQIEPLLNLEFPEEFPKHKTIGWLILNIIHRFPEEGEKIRVPETNLELEVVDKDEEYIDKVHITILEDTIEPEETPTE